MLKTSSLLFALLFCSAAFAQKPAAKAKPAVKTNKPVAPKQEAVPVVPEIEASFDGGEFAWKRFLEKTLNPMVPVDKGAKAGVYMVVIGFTVKTDGAISDIKPLSKHGYGMEEEAERVLKNSPKWKPALSNGRNVESTMKQLFKFVVQPQE